MPTDGRAFGVEAAAVVGHGDGDAVGVAAQRRRARDGAPVGAGGVGQGVAQGLRGGVDERLGSLLRQVQVLGDRVGDDDVVAPDRPEPAGQGGEQLGGAGGRLVRFGRRRVEVGQGLAGAGAQLGGLGRLGGDHFEDGQDAVVDEIVGAAPHPCAGGVGVQADEEGAPAGVGLVQGLSLAQQPGEQTYIGQGEGRIEHDLLRRQAQAVLRRVARDEERREEHDVQEPAAGGQDGGGGDRNDEIVVDQDVGDGSRDPDLVVERDDGQGYGQQDEGRVDAEEHQERRPPDAVRRPDPAQALRRHLLILIRIRAPHGCQESDGGGGAGDDGRQHEGRQEEPERPSARGVHHDADGDGDEDARHGSDNRHEYGDEPAHALDVGARCGRRAAPARTRVRIGREGRGGRHS